MPDLPTVPPPAVAPGFPPSAITGFPPAPPVPGAAPGTIPRGRPAGDPEANEARIARHQQKKELEAALPKRATEKKVLIYRDTKGTGRVPAAARPVLTVLLSDLTRVAEENKDIDENDAKQEYLAKKLVEKYGVDRVDEMAPFVCRVVDAQGNRISDFADWTLLDEDVDDLDAGDDDPRDPRDLRDLRDDGDFADDEPAPRARGGALREDPPRAQALDVHTYDALAAANRREGENAMTPIFAMMQQQAQAAAQAQAQQMQMLVAMMQNNQQQAQASEANKGGMIAAVLTALAPVLQQVLKPKEDNTEKLLAILLPVLAGRGDSSAEMMKMIPQILGEVSKQQMSLMGTSAQQTVHLQGEATKQIVSSMVATMKDMQKEAHAPAEAEGGGMFENLAKIAGPVIGAMMAPKAPEAPALEAPRLPAPQPPPRPRAPVKQAPPAPPAPPAPRPAAEQAPPQPPAPPAPPTPVEANPADVAERNIIRCFDAVLGWQAGRYDNVDKVKVLRFVRDNAPPPLLAAIRSADFAQVVAVGQDAVMKAPHLIAWISQEENQTYLQDFLGEVRDLDLKLTAEAEAAAKAGEKPAGKPAKPGIQVKSSKKAPPPPPAEPPPAANPPAAPQAQ